MLPVGNKPGRRQEGWKRSRGSCCGGGHRDTLCSWRWHVEEVNSSILNSGHRESWIWLFPLVWFQAHFILSYLEPARCQIPRWRLTAVSMFVMVSFPRSPRRKLRNSALVQLQSSRSGLEDSNQLPAWVHLNSPRISQHKFNPTDQISPMPLASAKKFLKQKASQTSVKNLHAHFLNSICHVRVWVKAGQRCWLITNQHRESITHSKIVLSSFQKFLCNIAALKMLIFSFGRNL